MLKTQISPVALRRNNSRISEAAYKKKYGEC